MTTRIRSGGWALMVVAFPCPFTMPLFERHLADAQAAVWDAVRQLVSTSSLIEALLLPSQCPWEHEVASLDECP